MQDNETNGLVAAGKSIATCERNPTLNRIELIQDLPIFNDLSPQDCSAIVSAAHEQKFHRHGIIFSEGSPCGLVLLLLSGCAKITQLGAAGCEVMLRLSGPGELIDGLAIYTGGINFVTARATRSTKALTWDVATFESFYNRYPILRRNISRYLSLRLQELEERYCEISHGKGRDEAQPATHPLVPTIRPAGQRRCRNWPLARGVGAAHRHHAVYRQPLALSMAKDGNCQFTS